MLAKLRNRLITGIAVIAPLVITALVLRFIVVKINSWILSPVVHILKPYLENPYHIYTAKLLVFFLVLVIIYLIGWAANIIVIRKFFGMGESIFIRVPMMGKIYSSIKQMVSAIFGHGRTFFKHVVLVEYPRKGVYSLGFVTNKDETEIHRIYKGNGMTAIFLPTSPNPTSGYFLLVPTSELIFLNMSVEDGMKIVISGGAVIPG